MMKRKTLVYISLGCLFLGVGVLIFPVAMRGVYYTLITEIPTDNADVIVVLSGATGARVREGVRLYHAGVAPKLLMTGGPFFETSMADVMAKYAISLGVPSKNILQESSSLSTHTNAVGTLPLVQQLGAHRVMIVTSRFHTARSYKTFRDVFPADIELFIAGSEDGVNDGDWWHHGEMAETVLIELGKTLYYRLRY
jgi:uncharacterized SAM-binding protein YcdF (DUF218 family)